MTKPTPEGFSDTKKKMEDGRLCPSCLSGGLLIFHKVNNIPFESNVMLTSREEALKFPRGDIVLAFCRQCGFITNIAFEIESVSCSAGYEDQQGFSPTFNSFAGSVAERLIKKYDLYDKDIIEVGCGKGDFLMLMCELGNNRGIGIDPLAITERVKSEAAGRVSFINDKYSERYSDYKADIVICRHTLEHIFETNEFISTVRRTIGNRSDTIVFFEVPDVTRILKEAAFWDIYYEHCSYFTPGSLARLFRSCGFEVIDLCRAYDNQYILIEAKPADVQRSDFFEIEDSTEQVAVEIDLFSSQFQEKMQQWRRKIERFHLSGEKIAIWGSGSKCVAFMTTLGISDMINYIVDINPFRHGKFISGVGKMIIKPENLGQYKPDLVIIMNPVYYDEIKQMLMDMDLDPVISAV